MRRVLVALVLALPLAVPAGISAQSDFVTTRFELYLDALRKQAGIPGLSAAIVQDDRIAWEAGSAIRTSKPAYRSRPTRPFYVADLTSTLSATLVLQCIEEGRHATRSIPSRCRPGARPRRPRSRDLLSHSPGPVPRSATSRHDLPRSRASIEGCTQDNIKEAISRRLLDRLAMTRSVPGQDVTTSQPSDFASEVLATYDAVLRQIGASLSRGSQGPRVPIPVSGHDARRRIRA